MDLDNHKVSSIDKFMNHLDLYPDDTTNKEIVIVGGGAVGLDVAEYFANRGASPTIIEMMDQIGRDLDPVTKSQTKEMMEKHHVKQMTSTKLKEVHEDYFIVENDGKESKIPFDYGFVCLGMKAYNPLYLQLKDYYQDKNGDVLEIGDCKRARRIIEGTQEGRNIIHLLKQKELL
ncbi:FAD-dependent oxidoreductase [Faecalibacillus intestinalis]|uniref:FAD-dependent oxidoreductase n=2 Tax=Faecalibacillus intestinalis TaxID=1982626 RepID=UPI001EDE4790|nr:FAD-dependent oxidoreductase [Faecalibacillus intestinalis]MCG4680823.1 NAD(P)/FAD-dependent oxidoreductase [Faecalibacillus intestinalis]MCG4713555.1 NAD(P)/FAD-dependent oxidoreductase [Faecalibacillus intestinalis]MCG4754853.1 NAD(P)/FAD-dependent oxidoreductase [Faecalibacillus intestinalis]